MDNVIQIIYSVTAALPLLLALGAGWKYLPVLRNFANEGILPLLNALVAFFVAFGGGTAVAHASILGDLGSIAGLMAKTGLSLVTSYLATKIHDKFLKPLTPQSPYRVLKGQ